MMNPDCLQSTSSSKFLFRTAFLTGPMVKMSGLLLSFSLWMGVSPNAWSCLQRSQVQQLQEQLGSIEQDLVRANTDEQTAESLAQLKIFIEETDQELPEIQAVSLLARELQAGFLQNQNRPIEAIEAFSEVVLRKYYNSKDLEFNVFSILLGNIHQEGLSTLEVQFYERYRKRQSGEALTFAREIMHAVKELSIRGQLKPIVVEATAAEIFEVFVGAFPAYIALNFVEGLVRDTQIPTIAPFLSYLYVHQVVRNKYRTDPRILQESIALLKPLLELKEFHYPLFYNTYSFLHMQLNQHLEASQVLARAHQNLVYPGIRNLYLLAALYLNQKKYEETIEVCRELLQTGDQLYEFDIDPKGLRNFLITALQKADRHAEASVYLRKIQEESLGSRRFWKPQSTQSQPESKSELQAELEPGPKAIVRSSRQKKPKNEQNVDSIDESPEDRTRFKKLTLQDSVYPVTQGSQIVEKSDSQLLFAKKEKVKTRGTPDFERPTSNSSASVQSPNATPRLKTVEEILCKQPNILDVFYKFFSNFEAQHVRVGAIDISMDEVNRLMEALGQDFDSSKGKGSHTKVTLKRDELQPDLMAAPAEQMIILAKHTKLTGAQIADIRDRFIHYYLFPEHLKEVLVRKQLLPL